MALRAKKPEEVKNRLKLFLWGEPSSGKTFSLCQFPRVYLIDTERGAEQSAYVKLLHAAEGVRLQTANIDDVITELKALLTEKHPYQTLAIDPVTNIEDNVVQSAGLRYKADEKDGGDMRVWRDRDKYMRRIASLLLQLDMNVVVTAHQGVKYGTNMVNLGPKYEGWKKWAYIFDLVLQLSKVGDKRTATVRKTRLEQFNDGESFDWSYAELVKRYGADIMERAATPVTLATPAQIAELTRLLDTVKLPEGTSDKWLSKAGVEEFSDMPSALIAKCIEFCQKRISPVAAQEGA